ncbi:tripartite tricarboxylate transporter substrate binding protein [Falsiroseomonas oryzae]|uniref:tripartite tricarboxylate transporter substrate binding protein n=1 Tax=Falsiroseomonas oryzae TaxID=2766473 RepID=UPI0022EA9433|nr:tripartite tricarboxylate transporter substrate binding protein [Roseomonas sp. MO-31]
MRRRLLLGALAAAPLAAPGAMAQDWPSRPIRIVVGFSPGGTADAVGRRLQAPLQAAFGQSVVVENRTGASGAVAAVEVARAAPDGHTLGVVVSTLASLPAMRPDTQFDPVRDFTPVVLVGQLPLLLVVHPSVPATDLAQLIALARRNPGRLNYASPGSGLAHHFAGEMLKLRAGLDIAHVPYRGAAPALADVVSGQVQMTFAAPPAVAGFIQGGQVRPIAMTGAVRSQAMPEIPTVAESGLEGFDVTEWYGIVGPANLPPAVVGRLNQAINASLQTPEQAAWLRQNAVDRRLTSAAEFGAFIRTEIDKLGRIAREARIVAD